MRALLISLIVFMGAATLAADKGKDDGKFVPGPAASYPAKQTNDHVTVAAAVYDTEELAHSAFGKLNPNQYGVLPVLVIIQNDTDQALKLEHLETEYSTADGRHVEATPPDEVKGLSGAARPGIPVPTPIPIRRKHKGPLNVWEIDGRAFAAKLIPAHESASGFFYFQTAPLPGSRFYLTGIKIASTGQDIFYFDIPLEKPK